MRLEGIEMTDGRVVCGLNAINSGLSVGDSRY